MGASLLAIAIYQAQRNQAAKDIRPHARASKTLTQFHTAPTKLHRYPRRPPVGYGGQYWGIYMSKNLLARLSLIALALTLSACDQSSTAEEQAPLATVRVETVEARPLSISSELSGRIVAPRIAEVRARVAGVVLQQAFREGSDVKKGDVLFRIDPAPFKADLDSAEAVLRKAEANAFQARLQEQRYAQLIDDKAISGQEYDLSLIHI